MLDTQHLAHRNLLARGIPSALLLALIICVSAAMGAHAGANKMYRYVNEDGVKVISFTLPSFAIQKGYEVINSHGQVIESVAPPVGEEEIAQKRATQRILSEYNILKRRYSSIEDIEAAKKRKLRDIDSSIAILRGNISGLNTQIDNLMRKAAQAERESGKVPKTVLTQLEDTRVELGVVENLLENRLAEYQTVEQKYEESQEWFKKGEHLERSRKRASSY